MESGRFAWLECGDTFEDKVAFLMAASMTLGYWGYLSIVALKEFLQVVPERKLQWQPAMVKAVSRAITNLPWLLTISATGAPILNWILDLQSSFMNTWLHLFLLAVAAECLLTSLNSVTIFGCAILAAFGFQGLREIFVFLLSASATPIWIDPVSVVINVHGYQKNSSYLSGFGEMARGKHEWTSSFVTQWVQGNLDERNWAYLSSLFVTLIGYKVLHNIIQWILPHIIPRLALCTLSWYEDVYGTITADSLKSKKIL